MDLCLFFLERWRTGQLYLLSVMIKPFGAGLNLHKAGDDSLKRGTDLEVVGNVCHSVNEKHRPPSRPRRRLLGEFLAS